MKKKKDLGLHSIEPPKESLLEYFTTFTDSKEKERVE